MATRQGFSGGDDYRDLAYSHEGRISDMDVVNRERTTADPFAPGAAGDPAKFDTLIYPLDLNPENFFPEAICFQVKKRIGLSIDESIALAKPHMSEMIAEQSATVDILTGGGEYSKRVEARMTRIAAKSSGDISSEKLRQLAQASLAAEGVKKGETLSIPQGLANMAGSAKNAVTKTFGAWNTAVAGQKKMTPQGTTANTLGNIYMNMPQNIQFSEPANWDQTSLGWVGAIGEGIGTAGARAVAGAAGNIGGAMIGGTIGSLFQALGIKSAGLMGAGIAALSSGSQIQAGLETKMGMTVNPYMEMMFQGVGFRKFTFNFVMRPRSIDEVKQVMGILKMFRMHSKPAWNGGIMGQGFMKYPMEFHISFLTLEDGSARVSKPNKMATNVDKVYNLNSNIPLMKPCVCTNVETNYTPQSIWTAYKGGTPVTVNLGLSFTETELVMSGDVNRGY